MNLLEFFFLFNLNLYGLCCKFFYVVIIFKILLYILRLCYQLYGFCWIFYDYARILMTIHFNKSQFNNSHFNKILPLQQFSLQQFPLQQKIFIY
jgi:hypothetical protein